MALSVTEMQRRLYQFVRESRCDQSVLETLSDEGTFTQHEDAIWDFKLSAGIIPDQKYADADFNSRCCELAKDIVALHNTYGGYLILGVSELDMAIKGFDERFDVDALVARIKADTGADLHFTFSYVQFASKTLGLILVPQRTSPLPVAFKKQAKASTKGKIAYRAQDIYFRDGSRSTPAESVDHLSFVFSSRTALYTPPTFLERTSILDNNLRARDPGGIEFIGRDADLEALWRWLSDRFSPVKLVTGIGGVGKTTLVRSFAEQILDRSPLGFERVIWLTAKKFHWRPMKGEVQAARFEEKPQFDSLKSLLASILRELAVTQEEIDEASDLDSLSELLTQALSITPSFVVVDDLDTLPEDEQIEVFQRINSIVHSVTSSRATSRVVITARLKLGAASAQLLNVKGFDKGDFRKYVDLVADRHGISLGLEGRAKLFDKFHRISEGSPLFAAEIVRLVARGDVSLDQCLERFKGADGEDIRRFSFERELDALTDSELSVIYALSLLEGASFVELEQVTEITKRMLSDNLQRLRDYHLVSSPEAPTEAGQTYEADRAIIMLKELIAKKMAGGKRRIEQHCARLRQEVGRRQTDAGRAISKIVALWEQDRHSDALRVAQAEAKARNFDHPDLQCVLGRAYLRVEPTQPDKADAAFRTAFNKQCSRHELFDLWIEAKRALGDWRGALDVATLAIARSPEPKYLFVEGSAYFALGEESRRSGELTSAISHFRKCGQLLNTYISQHNLKGLFFDMNQLRRTAFVEAINVAKQAYRDPSSAIEVWGLAVEAFDAFVRLRSVIVDGVGSLVAWAYHVAQFRDQFDEQTKGKMNYSLEQLDRIRKTLEDRNWDDELVMGKLSDASIRLRQIVSRVSTA